MTAPVLQVQSLSLGFGLIKALNDVALDVHEAEILSLHRAGRVVQGFILAS